MNSEKKEFIKDNENQINKEGNVIQQKVIDKQKQALLYSYETLGNLLSAAENFAGLQNEQYEKYNISSANSHNEFKSEFAWELHCFQMAIKKYKKKYGEYIFPEKYSKEKIINDIKRYIKNIKNEKDQTLYLAMINIISGKKIDINFDELFEELEKNSDCKFDPNKLSELIGPINSILEDIEKNAEEGKMDFNEEKSKQKEKLVNIKEEIPETLTIVIGKKGNLYITNEEKNEYKFIYEGKKKEKIIFLEDKIDLKKNKIIYRKK